MNLKSFLKDKILLLLLHLVCLVLLTGFLWMTGYPEDYIYLVQIFWIIILVIWLMVHYLRRRKYFGEMEQILQKMDKRYLLGEMMSPSFSLEDRLYRDIIRRSNKSVIEKIRCMEEEQKAYQEYIESWVHEIKAPITGIILLCENGRKAGREGAANTREIFRQISLENQRIENYVDMALYYARSEQVYQDYMIRNTDLQEVVYEVLEKNRLLLIQNGVRVEIDCEETAYTDGKWIGFILNQILLNSVKYSTDKPVFQITAKRRTDGVLLAVQDNGSGIREEELPRIFEKGFTGSNGREQERSTGMGLYLCRKLCDRLGIGIRVLSRYGGGTKVLLEFPESNYIIHKNIHK